MPWNILRFYILYNKIRDLWTWMFIQIHMEHHSYTGISSLVLLHLVTNPTTTPPPAFLTLFTRSSVLGLRGSGPPSPWLVSFSLMLRSVKTLASVGWDQSGSADHFMYHSTPHLCLPNQMVRPNECPTISDDAFTMNSTLMAAMVTFSLWTGTDECVWKRTLYLIIFFCFE